MQRVLAGNLSTDYWLVFQIFRRLMSTFGLRYFHNGSGTSLHSSRNAAIRWRFTPSASSFWLGMLQAELSAGLLFLLRHASGTGVVNLVCPLRFISWRSCQA